MSESVSLAGVCKFGCSTGLACNEFKSKKAGPFDSSLVCDECTWEQTSVYWTKVETGAFCVQASNQAARPALLLSSPSSAG